MSAKQKTVHDRGPSKLNLGIFVCSFDVCQDLQRFPFINYGLRKQAFSSFVPYVIRTVLIIFFLLLLWCNEGGKVGDKLKNKKSRMSCPKKNRCGQSFRFGEGDNDDDEMTVANEVRQQRVPPGIPLSTFTFTSHLPDIFNLFWEHLNVGLGSLTELLRKLVL